MGIDATSRTFLLVEQTILHLRRWVYMVACQSSRKPTPDPVSMLGWSLMKG